jgi:hypothetical protein
MKASSPSSDRTIRRRRPGMNLLGRMPAALVIAVLPFLILVLGILAMTLGYTFALTLRAKSWWSGWRRPAGSGKPPGVTLDAEYEVVPDEPGDVNEPRR